MALLTVVLLVALIQHRTDVSSSSQFQQAKPIVLAPIHTCFKGPPDSLTEMLVNADLVLTGRVVGLASRDRTGELKFTATAYRIEIGEILRFVGLRAIPERHTNVVRSGGVRDRGHYIEHSFQVGFPEFERGRDYLMFLVWNTAFATWVPAYGPDSAFDLTGETASSAGNAAVTKLLEGKTVSEVLELIRRGGR